MFTAFLERLARGAQVAPLRALIRRFRSNTRGNVAVISALACLPMVAAVGCVIDYTSASMIKTKLQAAADAASLAAVSANSSVIASAKTMSGSGAVSGGSTYATSFFNANLSTSPENKGYTSLSPTATVTKSGQIITSTVSFTANVPTYFMQVLGYSNVPVSGTSSASYTLPTYINFYLMLDVSGSMSFPSTTAEQQRLMAVNPDNLTGSNGYPGGCQFACHFTSQGACSQNGNPGQGPIPAVGTSRNPGTNPSPGGYCQGFIISRLGTTPTSFTSGTTNSTNGNSVNWSNSAVSTCSSAGTTGCIQLRADAVGYAVNALLSQANQTETTTGISNQFKVGLYAFIENLCTSGPNSSNSCSVGLTGSLTGSTITNFAAQLANLLDTGQDATLGSGGTHFENALNSMNSLITSVGTGSSSAPLPYVFIVTDGSQDYQTQSNGNWGAENGSRSWVSTTNIPNQNSATVLPGYSPNDEPNSTDYCTTMKNRGITVAVLYIPYGTIVDPNTSFASDEDGYANSNIASIPGALQSCASTNFFYTANTPADITDALVTMFEQAISTAHITN
jgi:Flp pilus assembly protein TadG